MPIHDWTRVDPGVFHHFHQRWIGGITDRLNQDLLPPEYYALAEQRAAGYGPDVSALKRNDATEIESLGMVDVERAGSGGAALAMDPRTFFLVESDLDFYRLKQNFVAVRDARDDELVAVVEIVSKGNKSGRKAFDDFVRKAADILSAGVHLLVVDLQPPTPRDPSGIHGAIWDELIGEPYVGPSEKPLTLVAYESGASLRAFVEPVAVGDSLPDMPLFLAPRRHVPVPLASTYDEAFRSVPIRWRGVVESGVST